MAAKHPQYFWEKLKKRIVITGPESSGKSTLAAWLAKELRLPMASEYARMYLEKNGASYDEQTVIAMAKQHLIHQQEMVPADAPLGIFDTDLLNYKIWCDIAYQRCDPSIIGGIKKESKHLYLICYPDLPWVPDPLREHPHDREMLFERHLYEVKSTGRPYFIIRGEGEQRMQTAKTALLSLTAGKLNR